MSNSPQETMSPAATEQDIQRLLGDLDASLVVAIMALTPTIADVEQAALWVAGEGETLPGPHQARRTVEAILNLIAVEDDEERRNH